MEKEFNNDEYSSLIRDLINDISYIGISNRGKIGLLRQQAEILVRRILNLGTMESFTLGEVKSNSNNERIKTEISKLDTNFRKYFISRVDCINEICSQGNHTQRIEEYSKKEIDRAEDMILDLYACIYIKFFQEIRFNLLSDNCYGAYFSLLPPIIRYKTWSYLFENDKSNIAVVDKLCLAIIKTQSKENALTWLSENAEVIKNMPMPSEYEKRRYYQKNVVKIRLTGEKKIIFSIPFHLFDNMYDILEYKITYPTTSMNEGGRIYQTFEEAKHYFEMNKSSFKPKDSNQKLFLELIEFAFMGRK